MSFHLQGSSVPLQCAASSFQLARAFQPLCHHHNHKLRRSSSSPLLFFHSPSPFPSATQTDTQSFVFPVVAAVTATLARVVAQCVYDARTFRAAAAAFPLDIELRQR